jgi:hypothetical protein
MQKIGWAKVKKTPPKLQLGAIKPVADEKTLEALITNRYEVMAGYAREMRRACKAEIESIKAKQGDLSLLKTAKRWLHRDEDKVPATALPQLAQARAAHPVLDKMVDHARRAAPDVAQHLAVARATGRRPASLVPPCRRKRHCRNCSSSPCAAGCPRLKRFNAACNRPP